MQHILCVCVRTPRVCHIRSIRMHKITHIGSWRIFSIVACGASMRTRSHRAARASVQNEKEWPQKSRAQQAKFQGRHMCVRRISSPCSCCWEIGELGVRLHPTQGRATIHCAPCESIPSPTAYLRTPPYAPCAPPARRHEIIGC